MVKCEKIWIWEIIAFPINVPGIDDTSINVIDWFSMGRHERSHEARSFSSQFFAL